MIDTPLMTISPGSIVIPADSSTSLYHRCEHSSLYINMLPVAPESEYFGDNLHCAVINSRGSGDSFSKVEVVADFAEDELLDIVFVTELKTTLARVMATKVRHRNFFSWWSARDVAQSHNDGVLVLVRDGWAKYVQKVEYWKGRLLWIDFAFPGGLKLRCVCVYASPVPHEARPMVARLQGVLSSASALGYQVILGGDLNGVFDPSCDRVPGQLSRSPSTPLMHFLAQQDLTDVFCIVHPGDHSLQSMTRIDPADPANGSRIDYILASPELALRVTHSQVSPVLGLATDHQLLFASFSLGMLTKCVRRSSLRKYRKAQSVWNFSAMTQEELGSIFSGVRRVVDSLITPSRMGTARGHSVPPDC